MSDDEKLSLEVEDPNTDVDGCKKAKGSSCDDEAAVLDGPVAVSLARLEVEGTTKSVLLLSAKRLSAIKSFIFLADSLLSAATKAVTAVSTTIKDFRVNFIVDF